MVYTGPLANVVRTLKRVSVTTSSLSLAFVPVAAAVGDFPVAKVPRPLPARTAVLHSPVCAARRMRHPDRLCVVHHRNDSLGLAVSAPPAVARQPAPSRPVQPVCALNQPDGRRGADAGL